MVYILSLYIVGELQYYTKEKCMVYILSLYIVGELQYYTKEKCMVRKCMLCCGIYGSVMPD